MNADYWLQYLTTMADPECSRVYSKGATARKELEQSEFVQFFFLCRATFMGCENQHYQYLRGLIDEKAYGGYKQTIEEQIAAFPGVRAMWQMVRHTYGSEFAKFMDAMIAQVPAHASSHAFKTWKALVEGQKAEPVARQGP
ncbi:MAG: hypothetical protein KIT81_16310 [Alphaproteobacteria bacterium]|nr:hypothetical protein [Alphaproteobacteria bacterium]